MKLDDFIILDTETTGYTPGQIMQLSYLIVNKMRILKGKNYFFRVETVPKGVRDLTGFNVSLLERLSGGMEFSESAEEIHQDLNGKLIVAHNAAFDESFLNVEFARLGIDFAAKYICTMKDTTEKFSNLYGHRVSQANTAKILGVEPYLVNALVKRNYEVSNIVRHDARWDTAELYFVIDKMLKEGYLK